MLQALGDFTGGDRYVDLSFREPQRWATMSTSSSRVAGTAVASTAVTFGDPRSGPVLLCLALAPGVRPPDAPAHGHASDTWRMSLLGTLPMGPDSYDAGEFRFQQGWKPYASDNYANGPEGGWSALVFGDRRGMRIRHVRHDGPAITPTDRMLAEWLGIHGDLVSEEDAHAPGPSSLATTLDDARTGARINGSFADADAWRGGDGIRLAAGAMGDRATGPVVLLTRVDAGRPTLGRCRIASDVVRLSVRGSCAIDGREYVAGDMRAQSGGTPLGNAIAGPDGLDEVIVVADRRHLEPAAVADEAWAQALGAVLDDVNVRLAER
jgi:hypothetical protein